MKWCLCLVLPVAAVVSCAQSPQAPLPTVAHVDLKRYTGLWYEQARLPNAFQKAGTRATARYTMRPDGAVEVKNNQYTGNLPSGEIVGSAKVVPESGNARLQVRFGGLAALAPVPDSGNYWIIDLAPDYSSAMVGTPDRRFLWLLSRNPKRSEMVIQRHIKKAKNLGFKTDHLLHADWSDWNGKK